MTKGNRTDALLGVLASIFTLIVAGYLLLPLIIVAIISLDQRTFIGSFPPPGLTLAWFTSFFTSGDFMAALYNSLAISSIAMTAAVLIGILTSYLLVRYPFRGRDIASTIFLSPLVVPGVVSGFGLLGFFAIVGPDVTFERLLLGNLILTFPYAVRTVSATLIGFDISIEEASRTLGASRLTSFTDVTLPMIKTGLIAAAVFAFAMSLNDVSISVFLVSPQTVTLSVILFNSLRYGYTPIIAAASVVLMGFTAAVIVLIEFLLGLDKFAGIGGIGRGGGGMA
jgi:putative spermidine/putrescine transport system permease protein